MTKSLEQYKKLISVIIRTRNEERWIAKCLEGVFAQKFPPPYDKCGFEVIIVDNKSSDKTLEKALQFQKIKEIISCEEYLPGKALNMGIEIAKGDFIACLSGHCLPNSATWLYNLLKNFWKEDGSWDPSVWGVYGRQEPLPFTSDADKRDLALAFGLDRKVQSKDSFFHNANSMIRRDIWQDIPFDETVTNIEDRIWAKAVLNKGYKIVYEPEASVTHYHGIHQDGDEERCRNVVKILHEKFYEDYKSLSIDIDKLNVIAIIPVRGPIQYLNQKPLLFYTVKRALESKYIKKVIVSTDNVKVFNEAKKLGAEVPFMRPLELSNEDVDLVKVLKYSLEKIEESKTFPDIVVSLEITFPFRPKDLLDKMILQLVKHGFDSVIAARRENKSIWKEKEGRIIQIDEGIMPRKFKDPSFIGLKGVGCVTHPEFLRKGNILGQKIGIYQIDNPYSHLEVRGEDDFKMASFLIKEWFK